MSKNLEIGIVGLPNVGKSTLFNALTNQHVLAANYPFATIEPNTGIVAIPDERLDKLAHIYNTDRIIPATVTFVDIAGLVAGASKGEGLGNQFLGHIRSCDLIVQVVRAFQDSDVVHVETSPNPKRDIDIINTELVLADLQTIDKRLSKIEKEARVNSALQPMFESLEIARDLLNNGELVYGNKKIKIYALSDLNLITAKPIIYMFNVDDIDLENKEKNDELSKLVVPSQSLLCCAKLESELNELDEKDARELLLSYGQNESGLVQLIKASYSSLGLQSFLTAGPKEVRAWTINKGATAPEAAGVIHTDFEKGFIAAEIVSYSDLVSYGSISSVRSAGKVRTEGKSYIMQPDDIVEFRFNN